MNDSTFQREDRYIVIKRSDLEKVPVGYWSSLIEPIGALQAHLPHRACLVIESDWPEYEPVWQMIERRMTGKPPVTAAEELEAVLHWRDKHAVAIKERDALQQRLNAADQRNDDFDSALSELAALREELYQAKGARDAEMIAGVRLQERLTDAQITELAYAERLTAAEHRNADDVRDAQRYRKLRKLTPYRFRKIQEASVTDGGDVLYFHSDRFDAQLDELLAKPTESGASE